MRRQDFAYHLPKELIASAPTTERTGSRLLCLDGPTGECVHGQFPDLLDQLQAGDVLVFNDTKVIPARVFGHKETGGRIEMLLERVLDKNRCLAHIRTSKSPKPGTAIKLDNGELLQVVGRSDELFELTSSVSLLPLLDSIGHMPLPPYINRDDTPEDQSRYQTVYGRHTGAVAAPTAGLHFDQPLLDAIAAKGVELVYVTLHVGAGTFQPVRADKLTEHQMHSEWMTISAEVCEQVNRAKAEGRRVIAVGTTSVRSLETAAQRSVSVDTTSANTIGPYQGETDIFIYPGYEFQVIDALITNFHLSESTLLMLVSAFAGYQHTMAAYQEAIRQRYRFFSYGDAMFITRNPSAPAEVISPSPANSS